MNERPVVFLAFANAPEAHLSLLKAESRAVYEALRPLEDAGRLALHREESVAFGELYDDLLSFLDRVVVFHYGGHANGEQLALEGGAGGATGLARLLGQQSSLRLVFLNGCATQGHVGMLLDAGVPAVIATSVPIGDRKAQEFASAFYAALAEGRSVSQAFDSARGFVEGTHGAAGEAPGFTRQIVACEDEDAGSPVLEWGLFTREDRAEDLEAWRLPDAQADWRAQLVDGRGPLRDLDGEPLSIDLRTPGRTVPAVHCRACGTTSRAPQDEGSGCPICGAPDPERGPARTVITGLVVPFAVSADEARAAVLEHLGRDRGTGRDQRPDPPTELRPLSVPYWVFDADTQTTFEAERGWNRTLAAVAPTYEWEPVRGSFDLGVDTFLVAAGSAPTGRQSGNGQWHWELDRAEKRTQLDDHEPFVLLDRPVQSAFDQVVAHLDREVESEVHERVGGHQHRNLTTDTRYRQVSARTVSLPHWYATVGTGAEHVDLVVNGQTGAIRPLLLPVAPGAQPREGGMETEMAKRTYEPEGPPPGPGDAVSVFSGAGIGLMVGVLLGLSVSPVVGIFVGALGTGLAGLLGFNDRHFSRAKGLRIGAFGLATVVGVAAGISVRTHDLFSRSLIETRDEYIALGFTPREALDLVRDLRLRPPALGEVGPGAPSAEGGDARVAAAAVPAAGVSAAAFSPAASMLFSSPVELTACAALKTAYDDELTSPAVVQNFRLVGQGWAELAAAVEAKLEGGDQKALLFIARDAACGSPPPSADAARCQRLLGTLSSGELDAEFAAAGELRPVRDRVAREISEPGRSEALRLLVGVFCPKAS